MDAADVATACTQDATDNNEAYTENNDNILSTHTASRDFAFLTLAGQNVAVYTSDGAVWEGIFVATDAKAAEAVVLAAALRLSGKDDNSDSAAWFEKCYIPMDTVMYINAVDVKMQTGNTATEKVAPMRPAPLPEQPAMMSWDADVGGDDFMMEEQNWKQGKSWDQFKANEKFGVKSTYDPNLYTTKLGSNYTPAQLAEAERKAREIEQSAAIGGIQQRIERGEDLDIDEGELYSDVKRAPPREAQSKKDVQPLQTGKTGAYVPPSKRPQGAAPPAAAPQQPPATVPPQPLTAPAPTKPPAPEAVSAPKEEPQQPAAVSPSASTSEAPKGVAATTSLKVTAKPFVPGGGAASVPPPPSDFMSVFVSAALEAVKSTQMNMMTNDSNWFQESYNTNYQPQSMGQGYSSGGIYNAGYNNGNNAMGGGFGPVHQNHQGSYGGQQFNGQPQNQSHYQSNQQQTFSPTSYGGGGRGRGRGGMQPQQPQPTPGGFGMGGRGGGQMQPQMNAPQPLDSVSEMPRGAPAPVSQHADPVSQETAKPKAVMKRGR